jgi:YD repeat-containing protein
MLKNSLASMLTLLLLAFVSNSNAIDYNPEFGTLTNSTVDVIASTGGKKLYIERFYNSANRKAGWFGKGYGSQFETYLVKELDGSLSFFEYGQSPAREYRPKDSPVDGPKLVDMILKKKGMTDAGAPAEIYRQKLLKSRVLRSEAARELGIYAEPKEGDTFFISDYDGEQIRYTKNRYVHTSAKEITRYFDKNGRLEEVRDLKKNQVIELLYDENNRVATIRDNAGNILNLKWNADNLIESIRSAADKTTVSASYSYNRGALEKVTNQLGVSVTYSFDNFFQLTKIAYSDKPLPVLLTYELKTRRLVSMTDSDGNKTTYTYKVRTEEKKSISSITMTKISPQKLELEKKSWVYTHALVDQGEKRLQELVVNDGVAETKTVFRLCCYPQPEKITSSGREVVFIYDPENRLIGKEYSEGRKLSVAYDKNGNVSEIKVDGQVVNFAIDAKNSGTIIVQGSDYKARIETERGRLKKMTYTLGEQTKPHVATYNYDKRGRLLQIEEDKSVLAKYVYNSQGEQVSAPANDANSAKLERLEKIGIDLMLLNEVSYSF